jgi:hypothetical protein
MSEMAQEKSRLEIANQVYLRRASKLILPALSQAKSRAKPATKAHVATIAKNLEAYGYIIREELLAQLARLDVEQISNIYDILLAHIRRELKSKDDLKPMYPGFPEQVMQASDAELYYNAVLHYLSNGTVMPSSNEKGKKLFGLFKLPTMPKPHLNIERRPFRYLHHGEDTLEKMLKEFIQAKASLSEEDRGDVDLIMSVIKDDVSALLPHTIPNRENAATILAALYKHTTLADAHASSLCNTSTDVLRLAAAFSGGDVSLATPVRFKLNRQQRRLLMSLLDQILLDSKYGVTDMLRYKSRWIRLGEVLHPGKAKKYAAVQSAFDVLRNNIPFEKAYTTLEKALQTGDIDGAIKELHWRPGDFARRLDHLLRIAISQKSEPNRRREKIDKILEAFERASKKVSTTILLQMLPHFEERDRQHHLRVFFPKGAVAKAQGVADELPLFSSELCLRVTTICKNALTERFAELAPLGDCYVSPTLKDFTVPLTRRSASKALRSVARGSRLPLPQGEILRFFLFWKNGVCRTDLDLSAVLFDENYVHKFTLAYYNMRTIGGVHSGDIVDAPDGASEFIDIPIQHAREAGCRFIVMLLNSYTLQPYCDLPECFAGWMARSKQDGGQAYEPRTVEQRVDIASNMRIAIPAIFDLVEERVIWADLSLSNMPGFNNNAAVNSYGIQLSLQSIVEDRRVSLYDLLALHVAARGRHVDESSAATVFDQEFAYDPIRIASEYL